MNQSIFLLLFFSICFYISTESSEGGFSPRSPVRRESTGIYCEGAVSQRPVEVSMSDSVNVSKSGRQIAEEMYENRFEQEKKTEQSLQSRQSSSIESIMGKYEVNKDTADSILLASQKHSLSLDEAHTEVMRQYKKDEQDFHEHPKQNQEIFDVRIKEIRLRLLQDAGLSQADAELIYRELLEGKSGRDLENSFIKLLEKVKSNSVASIKKTTNELNSQSSVSQDDVIESLGLDESEVKIIKNLSKLAHEEVKKIVENSNSRAWRKSYIDALIKAEKQYESKAVLPKDVIIRQHAEAYANKKHKFFLLGTEQADQRESSLCRECTRPKSIEDAMNHYYQKRDLNMNHVDKKYFEEVKSMLASRLCSCSS